MSKLENIRKDYHMWDNIVNVLRWIDLEIEFLDFVSIMWPSWSWKSTLMNIIWMLDVVTSGRYTFGDLEITGKKESHLSSVRWKKIGFVFQSYNVI